MEHTEIIWSEKCKMNFEKIQFYQKSFYSELLQMFIYKIMFFLNLTEFHRNKHIIEKLNLHEVYKPLNRDFFPTSASYCFALDGIGFIVRLNYGISTRI